MTRLPVLWLCGPPGAGKSAVAWALFSELSRQGGRYGYVDIDQLGMLAPAPPADRDSTRIKAVNLAAVLAGYQQAGASGVVVSGVALPGEVPTFESAVPRARISWARLTAEREQLHARFLGRDGPVELLDAVDRHAEALDRSGFAQAVVDTTAMTVAEAAAAVEAAVRDWAGRDEEGVGLRVEGTGHVVADAPPARVLLVCGPHAVGSSTVGWEAFQALTASGGAAFVDLAQVGFVGEPSARPDGRHALRAVNLAAMTANFRAGGAQVVVAVGSVLRHDDLELYRQALAPAGVSVVRLRAAPADLRRRVLSRTAARGGPHLAGDELRGRPPVDVEPAVARALDEAAQLEADGLGDLVVDTSSRSPADCAQELLAGLHLT